MISAEVEGEAAFRGKSAIRVVRREVELGKTYPLFGMITEILEEREEFLVLEVNFSIKVRVLRTTDDKTDLLRERAFESAIFVGTILTKEPQVEMECKTIIFGKSNSHHC